MLTFFAEMKYVFIVPFNMPMQYLLYVNVNVFMYLNVFYLEYMVYYIVIWYIIL